MESLLTAGKEAGAFLSEPALPPPAEPLPRPIVERLLRERCREPELLELCKRRGIPA